MEQANKLKKQKKSKKQSIISKDEVRKSSGKPLKKKRQLSSEVTTAKKCKNNNLASIKTDKDADENMIFNSNTRHSENSPPKSIKYNSIKEGLKMFGWLLNPMSVDEFFEKYWEKAACLIKRDQANYFSHLISFEAIDRMLLDNHVEFTKNIDVTSYKNGMLILLY